MNPVDVMPSAEPTNQDDWNSVAALCVRAGWAMGWSIGALVGIVGLASGDSPELAALQAGIALVGFALLGGLTGILLHRMAPEATPEAPEEPSLGTRVDTVVGDDDVWPETPPGATAAAQEADAA